MACRRRRGSRGSGSGIGDRRSAFGGRRSAFDTRCGRPQSRGARIERQRTHRLPIADRRSPIGDRIENLRHFPGAEHCVDLGNLTPQFVAITLGQAARHDEPRAVPVALLRGHLQNRVDRLLFGGVDERAGVDDQHLGALGVGGDLVAGVAGHAQHDLAVDEILGAAETEETDFHWDLEASSFPLPASRASLPWGLEAGSWQLAATGKSDTTSVDTESPRAGGRCRRST